MILSFIYSTGIDTELYFGDVGIFLVYLSHFYEKLDGSDTFSLLLLLEGYVYLFWINLKVSDPVSSLIILSKLEIFSHAACSLEV